MANRNRPIQVKFRVTPEERVLIDKRMAQAGTINMAAYLRKMAIDGYVVKLELPELRDLISLLRRTSNNFNQIARRVNSTNRIYEDDIHEMKLMIDKTWEATNKVLENSPPSTDFGILAHHLILRYDVVRRKEGLSMKVILKIVFAPVIVALAIIIWIFALTLSLSAWVFGVLGTVFGILGLITLLFINTTNGIIILVFAFFVSPVGLPMLAAWTIGQMQRFRYFVQDAIYG